MITNEGPQTTSAAAGDKKKGTVQYFLSNEEEKALIDDYVPLNDEFLQWSKTIKSPRFGIKKYKDSIFKGEIDDSSNNRHGRGAIIYNSNRIYEGQWFNDKRHGKGSEIFANGNTYVGEYNMGKVQGSGKYSWMNGEEYEGQFW